MLKIGARDVKALIEALIAWDEVKPGQVGKRRVFHRYGLIGTSKDRVFTAIIYGIARRQGLIDRIIAKTCCNPRELDKPTLMLLRALVYEKYFGSGKSSNVYTSLVRYGPLVVGELAKHSSRVGDVSLLVRRIDEVDYKPGKGVEELEFKYNTPYWFIEKLAAMLGWSEALEFLEATSKPPLLSFRVNTLKATVEEVLEELKREGYIVSRSRYVETVIKVHGPFNYSSSKLLREGKIVPQDDASALASILLDPKPGMTVVDLCAAPGGKTTHLAELMKNQGRIIAFELFKDRARRLKLMIKRTGVRIAEVHIMDARRAVDILGEGVADRVLLDPPCSSTGALAKHPEAKWRLNEETLEKLVRLQRELLEVAVKLLKPKGRLLYTTCSVLREENEDNIEWILDKYQGLLRIIKLKKPFDQGFIPGTMRAWPHRHGVTGFFYALLEKKG